MISTKNPTNFSGGSIKDNKIEKVKSKPFWRKNGKNVFIR